MVENVKEFLLGGKKALPIVAGYLPLGFACGVIADNVGLSAFQIGIMSLLVFAGAAQYIAIGMIGANMPALSIILTVLIVNLRHLLYTSALYPYVSSWSFIQKAIFSFQITDETFALQSSTLSGEKISYAKSLGINCISHFGWIFGSVLGGLFGSIFENSEKFGLDFALIGLFIALLTPQLTNKPRLITAIIAGGLSLIFAVFGYKSLMILAAIISSFIGLYLTRKRYE